MATKRGRPSKLTPKLAEAIYSRLCHEPVGRIFKDPKMPSKQTFYNWCRRSQEFFDASARARAIYSLLALDEIESELHDAEPYEADIGLLREKLQHARWKASRLLSSIFSEKTKAEVTINNQVVKVPTRDQPEEWQGEFGTAIKGELEKDVN